MPHLLLRAIVHLRTTAWANRKSLFCIKKKLNFLAEIVSILLFALPANESHSNSLVFSLGLNVVSSYRNKTFSRRISLFLRFFFFSSGENYCQQSVKSENRNEMWHSVIIHKSQYLSSKWSNKKHYGFADA